MTSLARWTWIVAVALLGLFAAPLAADDPAVYTWTGGGSDGLWITPGNWDLGEDFPGVLAGADPDWQLPDRPWDVARFTGTGPGVVDLLGIENYGFEIYLSGLQLQGGDYTIQDSTVPPGGTTSQMILESLSQTAGQNVISAAIHTASSIPGSGPFVGTVSGGRLELTNTANELSGSEWTVTGGELSLAGGTFTGAAVALSGTGRFSIQEDVTLREVTAVGGGAVIDTGANELQVTETYQADEITISTVGAPVGLKGSNLVTGFDRVRLTGGEVTLGGVVTIPEGAKAHYAFEDPANLGLDSIGDDESGNHQGSPGQAPGVSGMALSVTGGSGISFPDLGLLEDAFNNKTWSLWVSPGELVDNGLIFEEGGGTNGVQFDIDTDGLLDVHMRNDNAGAGKEINLTSTADVSAAAGFTHVAVTFEDLGADALVRLFINGVEEDSVTWSGYNQIKAHGSNAAIGNTSQGPPAPANNFDGLIDEFYIYQTALIQAEIDQLAHAYDPLDLTSAQLLVSADTALSLTTNVAFGDLNIAAGQTLTKLGTGTLELRQETAANQLPADSTVKIEEGTLRMIALEGDDGLLNPMDQGALWLDGGTFHVAATTPTTEPFDMTATNVAVSSDSGLAASGISQVLVGNLTFDAPAVLSTSGADFAFAATTLAAGPGATVGLAAAADANMRILDLHSEHADSVLQLSGGDQFELAGTLHADVHVQTLGNTRARLVDGLDLNHHTLTLEGRDYRVETDPGAGEIVSRSVQPLPVSHGADGTPWNTAPGELEVTLENRSGIEVFVEEGGWFMVGEVAMEFDPAVNTTPIQVNVADGVGNAMLRAAPAHQADIDPVKGTTVLHGLELGAGSSANVAADADDQLVNILHVDLGPNDPNAELSTQVGLLDMTANGGINPTTGEPWKPGDTYRFVFHTSEDGDNNAFETDIEWYNAHVQSVADASTVYPISAADGVPWKVIGSTATVDARDNTHTNPEVDGPGETIFLLDGTTVVAEDYEDLWDGEIQHIINLTEQGEERAWWPFTGTKLDGTKRTGGSDYNPLGGGRVGQGNASETHHWVWRLWTGRPPDNILPFYALSDSLALYYPGALNLNGRDLAPETITGSGSIINAGTVALADGGTLAPGQNGIGGIKIDGDLTLGDGATYVAELQEEGTSDLVAVTGTLDLQGTDDVLALDWLPGSDAGSKFGGEYVVAQAAVNELLGEFDQIAGNIGAAYLDTTAVPGGVEYDQGLEGEYPAAVAVFLYDLLDGDANLDGSANGDDLSLVAGAWLGAGAWGDGDFNFDGTIDGDDLSLLAGEWNTSVGGGGGGGGMTLPAAAVPEPGSLLLLLGAAAAALAFAWRRRR